jgi:hypothetical protein
MRTLVIGWLALSSLGVIPVEAADAPPDLRLRWIPAASPVRGSVGETAELQYELSNAGGSPAFAVIVRVQTTVGPVGQPVRLQPGPAAGASMSRKVTLALVQGMREICIDAALQNRGGSDPPEANLENNRICRAISIAPQSGSEEATK